MDKIANGNTFNLSTGIYTSFASLAATAARIFGYRPAVIEEVSQPSGVHARAGDITKQSQFGIKVSTSIEHGISRALEFFQKSASPSIRKRSA
jgi:GDP-L-fucose synthase